MVKGLSIHIARFHSQSRTGGERGLFARQKYLCRNFGWRWEGLIRERGRIRGTLRYSCSSVLIVGETNLSPTLSTHYHLIGTHFLITEGDKYMCLFSRLYCISVQLLFGTWSSLNAAVYDDPYLMLTNKFLQIKFLWLRFQPHLHLLWTWNIAKSFCAHALKHKIHNKFQPQILGYNYGTYFFSHCDHWCQFKQDLTKLWKYLALKNYTVF